MAETYFHNDIRSLHCLASTASSGGIYKDVAAGHSSGILSGLTQVAPQDPAATMPQPFGTEPHMDSDPAVLAVHGRGRESGPTRSDFDGDV